MGDTALATAWGSTSCYLVRHAEAGVRTDRADDQLRPLSAVGRQQARSIAAAFESIDVVEILSSPYLRCVETLDPLAERRGRNVVRVDELAEGAPIDAVLRLLERIPPGSVVCTHGEIMTALLQRVVFVPTTDGTDLLAKGVIWELHRNGGCITVVQVVAAPAISASTSQEHHFNVRAVAGGPF